MVSCLSSDTSSLIERYLLVALLCACNHLSFFLTFTTSLPLYDTELYLLSVPTNGAEKFWENGVIMLCFVCLTSFYRAFVWTAHDQTFKDFQKFLVRSNRKVFSNSTSKSRCSDSFLLNRLTCLQNVLKHLAPVFFPLTEVQNLFFIYFFPYFSFPKQQWQRTKVKFQSLSVKSSEKQILSFQESCKGA